jgi:hypothetical protein
VDPSRLFYVGNDRHAIDADAQKVSSPKYQVYSLPLSSPSYHHSPSNMPNQIQDLHIVDADSFPYIFEQNATVKLQTSDGLVRVNVFRPKTDEKVPVLCTYGPYGKDIPYKE